MWSGVGSCSRIPDTRSSAPSSASNCSTSSWETSAGSLWLKPSIPTSAHAFCLPPTYTAEAGSSPTSTVASPGRGLPAATQASTSSRTSERTCWAIALPSISVALMSARDDSARVKSRACSAAAPGRAALLGSKTYDGYLAAWPERGGDYADKIDSMPKHVVSSTLREPEWNNTTVLVIITG